MPTPRITWLDELDLSPILQGWEAPKRNRSVTGTPLRIGGRSFARGIGTHTVSYAAVRLAGGSVRFQAWVGVDDAVGLGRMIFQVRGDGRLLFDSGLMEGRQEAARVDVDVTGVDLLELYVEAPNDVTHHGHADWAEACLLVTGAEPAIIPRPMEPPYTLTPPPAPEPRITGAQIVGGRPGAPFLFRIPALGAAGMTYDAEGLPDGLALDHDTGIITGRLPGRGTYPVTLVARNAHGTARRAVRLVAGDALCLTPPMGWNSWNSFGPAVSAEDARAAARAMAERLAPAGYQYVNIDDGWQGVRSRESAIPLALQPNEKFPDMAGLVAEIHALGLRAGIYSVPQTLSCAGLPGGSADTPDGVVLEEFRHGFHRNIGAYRFEREDAAQYAAWGFDLLKYDAHPSADDCRRIREAMDATGRDIALSFSAGMRPEDVADYRPHVQTWRTTGDLIDTWFSVRAKFRAQRAFQDLSAPGAWNDPDMLVVGWVGPGWNAPLQPTRLSPTEQYFHLSLWAMLGSPLLIGADLTKLDDFTVALLTNADLIDIHQDALGRQARLVSANDDAGMEVWSKPLANGETAVALVNVGDAPRSVSATWSDLGLSAPQAVRDVWRQMDLGTCRDAVEAEVPPHGVSLLRIGEAT